MKHLLSIRDLAADDLQAILALSERPPPRHGPLERVSPLHAARHAGRTRKSAGCAASPSRAALSTRRKPPSRRVDDPPVAQLPVPVSGTVIVSLDAPSSL